MAFSDEQISNLRATLGLPETADEAAIVAAVSAVVEDSLEETPARTAPAVTASAPEGTVIVEADVFARLREGAEAGVKAAEKLADQERETLITDAIRTGKITPARADHWRTAHKADPEGTKAALDGLAAGLHVNTDEGGHGLDSDQTTAAADGGVIDVAEAELNSFLAGLRLTKEALNG